MTHLFLFELTGSTAAVVTEHACWKICENSIDGSISRQLAVTDGVSINALLCEIASSSSQRPNGRRRRNTANTLNANNSYHHNLQVHHFNNIITQIYKMYSFTQDV